MKNNDWKDRLNVVYSTNPDYKYDGDNQSKAETLPPTKQKLRVSIDRRNRAGKVVTLVTGFVGQDSDLQTLGKMLKTKCGVGGTAKDNEILIQGDRKEQVITLLRSAGYKV